jgi:hypothetical protein
MHGLLPLSFTRPLSCTLLCYHPSNSSCVLYAMSHKAPLTPLPCLRAEVCYYCTLQLCLVAHSLVQRSHTRTVTSSSNRRVFKVSQRHCLTHPTKVKWLTTSPATSPQHLPRISHTGVHSKSGPLPHASSPRPFSSRPAAASGQPMVWAPAPPQVCVCVCVCVRVCVCVCG